MKSLDIIMLVPLLWGAFNGYRKGLLVEMVAVLAFVVAMIVGFRFLAFGIDLLSPYISRELARKLLPVLGFSVIFFPVVFMVNRLGFWLRGKLRQTLLGTFDSVAGAVVGVFTWVFGISVILWLLGYLHVSIPATQTNGAYLYPLVRPVAPLVMNKTADWPKRISALAKQ